MSCAPSAVQHGMLFHHLRSPESGVDIEQMVCTLPTPLDVQRFVEAWERCAAQHPALRVSFVWQGQGAPSLVVTDTVSIPLVERDLRGPDTADAAAREAVIEAYLRADRRQGFRFDEAPLMRLALFRTAEESYRFVWTFSHALVDGNVFTDLLSEVFAAYAALVRGEAPQFDARTPYTDYLAWLPAALAAQREPALAHYRTLLAGFEAPTALPRPDPDAPSIADARDTSWAEQAARLSRSETDALRALGERVGVPLSTLVQAAWAQVLAAHSGDDDVVFGVTRAARRGTVPGAERVIGLFINTLPLRVKLAPKTPVVELLRALRDQYTAARPFEQTPLVDVQGVSEVRGGAALFDSIIVFNAAEVGSQLAARKTERTPLWPSDVSFREQTNFSLTLFGYAEVELLLKVTYDPRKLDAATGARVLELTCDVLSYLAAHPDAEVGALPRAARSEQALVRRWNETARPVAPGSVHGLFEAQVARTPDAPALVFRDLTLSYRELDARANRLAHALRARGVGSETLVGLCVERSLDMVVGLLGILKAGGAYVPLDPVYPRQRLAMMLEDSAAPVLVTQTKLRAGLPPFDGELVCVDELDPALSSSPLGQHGSGSELAYVIFTSGSTGRPKGVMVQHGNVLNFFAGMDEALGHTQGSAPGTWLAVTSISFDISVLELFWTLCRGFRVVVQEESDRASLAQKGPVASATPMGFGLFYFAADTGAAPQGHMYKQLLEGAKFADRHGFTAVWTPERHFHAFGGLYPNPVVTTAALATITERVQLRAGSVVLPLHNPLRVAEDWAVVDHLSNGRVGLSFATGWHANDFAFFPEKYAQRQDITLEHLRTVEALWRGEKVKVKSGSGEEIEVSTLPRPLQEKPPVWLAAAVNPESFRTAGRVGTNVLTNMLGQSIEELESKIAIYREARRAAGHPGEGVVSVMLHTFVCDDDTRAKEHAKKPFCNYLATSFDLVKVAPWMFPAFKQPSRAASEGSHYDATSFTDEDMAALLEHAFDRYFDTAGLFGTPERALAMVERLKRAGANEVACLIDFGIDPDVVLQSLPHLDRLRQLANPAQGCAVESAAAEAASSEENAARYGIPAQIRNHGVTHLQCTPSMARMLMSEPEGAAALLGLQKLLLGGEALPQDLIDRIAPSLAGTLHDMYGPTETTVWSSTAIIDRDTRQITIGRPIANTQIHILQAGIEPAPIGAPGELCIGGAGVVRGYLGRPDLTAERFVPDPFSGAGRLYRTGDLARYRHDGRLEFLSRIDHQVKVNGYRIELGEIEAVLSRHPSVRQNVVMARSDDGAPAQLVGYVVLGGPGEAAGDGGGGARVEAWEKLWDETYKQSEGRGDARFNIAGWNSSYTGEPIPEPEMREWLEHTVARILALSPRRVLEIGCGTGMILYRVAPQVSHYTGVDLSAHALASIAQRLSPEERDKVTLQQGAAHALAGIAERSLDTVVINSVAQYFPDAAYLVDVLRRALSLVADGGRIFLGDLRSRAHLEPFHTLVELHHAAPETRASELSPRVGKRVAQEAELVLDEAFFHALARELPRIREVQVELKRGRALNELTAFRYDVVLHVGTPARAPANAPVLHDVRSLDAVRAALAHEPAVLALSGVPNTRLASIAAVTTRVAAAEDTRADALLASLTAPATDTLDPEALYTIDPRYTASLRFSPDDPARFDAVLRHVDKGQGSASPLPAPAHAELPDAYANRPESGKQGDALLGELRTHLRSTLPEYMVPAAFVVLSAFPTTPNGKIDRKALPAPERGARRAAASYSAPEAGIEQTIAGIWQEMLNLERVGRNDNIFELGANSLLTVQANNRLSAALGRKVSLVSMFRFPTVQSLAAHLGDDGKAAAEAEKRGKERDDRKKDAAERRRQARAERGI